MHIDRQGSGCGDQRRSAFTMLELLVAVATLVLLSGMLLPAMAKARMRAQGNTCLNNLKYLGTAGTMYEYDNGAKMAYAGLRLRRGVEMSWDDLFDPYLGGTLTPSERWSAPYYGSKGMAYLRCPSDHAPAAAPSTSKASPWRRSYAMPRYLYDPQASPWPPNIQSRAGVGMYWSFDDDGTPDTQTKFTWNRIDKPGGDGSEAHPYPRKQWAMRATVISQPAETIFLTERIHAGNLRGDAGVAYIDYPAQHCESGVLTLDDGRIHAYAPAGAHHNGLFNYLMVDGHVEMLDPQVTVRSGATLKAQSKMWTIRPGD